MKNEKLSRAVKHLYNTGVIENDKDIADKMGKSQALVSNYLKGKVKPSFAFIREFEKMYKLSLEDFTEDMAAKSIVVADSVQLIAESILQMKAEMQTNRQMMVELMALVSKKSVSEVQLMADSLLKRNIEKILSGL
jgi:predicted transcriptional regulator